MEDLLNISISCFPSLQKLLKERSPEIYQKPRLATSKKRFWNSLLREVVHCPSQKSLMMGKMCSSSADKQPSYQRVNVASSSLNLITLCFRLKVFGFPGNLGNITPWPWIPPPCPWQRCRTKLLSRSCFCFFRCSYLLLPHLVSWPLGEPVPAQDHLCAKGLLTRVFLSPSEPHMLAFSWCSTPVPSKFTSTLSHFFHRQWTNILILQDYIEYLLWVNIQYLLWASPVAQLVKNPPAMRETWVQFLGWEDPLEKGKATHSSILAWRTSPWGHKELDTT